MSDDERVPLNGFEVLQEIIIELKGQLKAIESSPSDNAKTGCEKNVYTDLIELINWKLVGDNRSLDEIKHQTSERNKE